MPTLLFLPLRLPAWLVLGVWFALQWLYSAGYGAAEAGSVAYLAHVLGFLAGLLVALPLGGRRSAAYRRRRRPGPGLRGPGPGGPGRGPDR